MTVIYRSRDFSHARAIQVGLNALITTRHKQVTENKRALKEKAEKPQKHVDITPLLFGRQQCPCTIPARPGTRSKNRNIFALNENVAPYIHEVYLTGGTLTHVP